MATCVECTSFALSVGVLVGSQYGGQHSVGPTNICLHLGLTDYATFVGTNLNPDWSRFKVAGDDADVASRHFANPLGNAAVVTTSDHRILLLQRSTQVGEFPNCSVFPGGHPEVSHWGCKLLLPVLCPILTGREGAPLPVVQPSEAGIHGRSGGEGAAVATSERAAAEMFAGIVREVVEETGVPIACLVRMSPSTSEALGDEEIDNLGLLNFVFRRIGAGFLENVSVYLDSSDMM